MKDIVEKYQYYFAETNRLQTIAEEQEKYIAELEAILLEVSLTDQDIIEKIRKKARGAIIGLGIAAGVGTGVGVSDAMQDKPKLPAGTVFRQSAPSGLSGEELKNVVAKAKNPGNKKIATKPKSNEQGTS